MNNDNCPPNCPLCMQEELSDEPLCKRCGDRLLDEGIERCVDCEESMLENAEELETLDEV